MSRQSSPPEPSSELSWMIELIEEGFRKTAWHGPNLRGAVRGVSAQEAIWRPVPLRKNIWEHVLHAAYWKYTVRRRMTGEKRGTFFLKGSNWFTRSSVNEKQWKEELDQLTRTHTLMLETIQGLDPPTLDRPLPKSKLTYRRLLRGIALHDVYHAGQILTLKRQMLLD